MFLRPAVRAVSESSFSLRGSYDHHFATAVLCRKCLRLGIRPSRVSLHVVSRRCERRGLCVPSSKRGVRSWQSSKISNPGFPLQSLTQLLSISTSPHTAVPVEELAGPVRGSSGLGGPMQAADNTLPSESSGDDVIVQYIVIRKDLTTGLSWPLGSVITQGCHAAVAAIWPQREDPVTLKYCAPDNLDKMHKVTLEVKGEVQLRNLAQKLETEGVIHKLWIEQPENYATCLATKPYYKSEIASHFKKLKLCK